MIEAIRSKNFSARVVNRVTVHASVRSVVDDPIPDEPEPAPDVNDDPIPETHPDAETAPGTEPDREE